MPEPVAEGVASMRNGTERRSVGVETIACRMARRLAQVASSGALI
jgi:hypothetical protein